MLHLGLDFGTTTSILSYHNGPHLESFKLGGATETPYIPSVLSIEKSDNSPEIGKAARLNQGNSDYQVYSYFKMLLAEQNTEKLAEYGYVQQSPQTIAKQYLEQLISRYRKECGINQPIEKLVITVPEIWVREGNHAAREALKNICTELQWRVKLLSEPVAASVYFADRFNAQHQCDFHGHVLVCDYGGGTLDLSLSAVEPGKITVLEGTGKGSSDKTVGIAGVAFDKAVVTRVLNGQTTDDKNFYKLLRDFEEHKITLTDKLDKSLARYRKNSNVNKKMFEIGDHQVKPKDLASVFDQLIQPELHNALTEMKTHLQTHQVDTSNPDRFRVVMVGGFSNFYLVRRTVREFFNSDTDTDRRFHSGFDLTDTALAISKGAALVANGAFKIDMACPISVGIRAKNAWLENEDILLLKKGIPVERYQQPRFSRWLEVGSEKTLNTQSLTLFLDIGSGKRRYIDLKGKLTDLIPNPTVDNKWQVGFAVDDDVMFTLHVKDQQGVEKTTPLGNLEEKISGLHICEE
jgi:molecular chaperone DnaK